MGKITFIVIFIALSIYAIANILHPSFEEWVIIVLSAIIIALYSFVSSLFRY